MKILQINKLYYPWVGGVETVVRQIAEGLNGKNSLQVDVLVCNQKNKRTIEEVNGVKVFRAKTLTIFLGMPISFDFLYFYSKIEKDYDLIFLHYPFPLGFLAYVLFSPRKKLVIWYHSDIVKQKLLEWFFRPFHLFCLRKARKIFVSNPKLLASSKTLRKFQKKCKVLPFGVDLNYFLITKEIQEQAEKIKEKLGAPLVLSVGRLTYYKGFDFLIQAMRRIPAKLLIIGEGKRKKKLLRLIKKLKIKEKVIILPSVKDLRPYYLACDLFVLPSIAKSESFGIVLLEAMAYQKPVISTELGTGTSWVNLDKITGLVVKSKDVKSLQNAIKRLLEDKKLFQMLSENAKKRAEELNLDDFLENLKIELLSL